MKSLRHGQGEDFSLSTPATLDRVWEALSQTEILEPRFGQSDELESTAGRESSSAKPLKSA
jgi:hypothetical protein